MTDTYEFTNYDWMRITSQSEWDGDCLLWTGARQRSGYGIICWNGKCYTTHRLMLMNKLGHGLDGLDAAHTCNRPSCINPDHLTAKTHRENLRDRISAGTWGRYLTDADVRNILASPLPTKQLAADLGVSYNTVNHIRKGKTWRHITNPSSGTDTSGSSL